MIYVDICGGLGNQMFQYAAGLALAQSHNTELALILSNSRDYLHPYSLPSFKLRDYKGEFETPKNRLQDIGLMYNDKFFNIKDGERIYGYFQNENYFKHIKNSIYEDFRLDLDVKRSLIMPSQHCCSLHVRRGDYLSPVNIKRHGCLSLEYYKKAIEIVNSKTNIKSFLVFSNDVKWCKENFNFGNYTFTFAENKPDYVEVIQMSMCDAHIIANSTFSWWGAWLNKNKNAVVICPGKWYADGAKTDIVPERWIKI
jgi:hypothetical protein